jgi:hypothetical protein
MEGMLLGAFHAGRMQMAAETAVLVQEAARQ